MASASASAEPSPSPSPSPSQSPSSPGSSESVPVSRLLAELQAGFEEFDQGDVYDEGLITNPTTKTRPKAKTTTPPPSSSHQDGLLSKHHLSIKLVGIILLFRAYNAIVLATSYSPDEYWQVLEVAHEYVFGYGIQLTWEWSMRIRGSVHVLLFSAVYWVLKLTGTDQTMNMIIISPKLFQSLFAAVTDIYTYKLANKLYGEGPAKWAMVASLLSMFNFFCSTRTLSNSIETSLTVVALYYWPWSGPKNFSVRNFIASLSFAAMACILRPTNAIIWVIMGLDLFMRIPAKYRAILITLTLAVGLFACSSLYLIDTAFYGQPTFTPYNFILFNLARDVATFYGSHPWHWYLTQGLPFVFFSYTPFVMWTAIDIFGSGKVDRISDVGGDGTVGPTRRGSTTADKSDSGGDGADATRLMLLVILGTVAVYSLLRHKEFRFIMQLLPLACLMAGRGLYALEVAAKSASGDDDAVNGVKGSPSRKSRSRHRSNKSNSSNRPGAGRGCDWFQWVLGMTWTLNGVVGLYLATVHQRGVVDVMLWFRKEMQLMVQRRELQEVDNGTDVDGILFLMPCHSTPMYSYLHYNVPTRFLSCEPPIMELIPASGPASYRDESDIFYDDPRLFLTVYSDSVLGNKTLPWTPVQSDLLPVSGQAYQIRKIHWPSHVVFFEALWDVAGLEDLFAGSNYSLCARFFNSHFHDDGRRSGDVMVYCR